MKAEFVSVALDRITGGLQRVSTAIRYVSIVFLLGMALLTVVDAIGRYLIRSPLVGAAEMVGLEQLFVISFAIVYTWVLKGHITIDIVCSKFPQKVQALLDGITRLVTVGLLAYVVLQMVNTSFRFKAMGQHTGVAEIPLWPFALIASIGFALLGIVILVDFLNQVWGSRGRGERWLRALPAVIVLVLLGVLTVCFGQLPQIGPVATGIVGLLLLLFLFTVGMPVAYSLALIGFLGMSYLRGAEPAAASIGAEPFRVITSYGWCAVSLFVLMGYMAFAAGFGRNIYYTAYTWLGSLPGGLAMATVGGCAGFAAVSGSTTATSVAIGAVGYPEMKRYKYAPSLSTGAIASGGTLGILIPPSISMIVYGELTGESIGALFIAGILPGILLAVMFMVMIYFRALFSPQLAARGPRTSFVEKVVSLKGSWAMLLLFFTIIGGIYGGVFTPTEAGGIGAAVALVIGLIQKGFTRKGFIEGIQDAVRLLGMIFLILVGAGFFIRFLALSRLPMEIAGLASGLPWPPLAILLIVLVVWLILGCFMPSLPMLVLTIPIFYPLVLQLGYDPIWFGIILVLMNEMALLTPPVGMNLYATAGVAKDIPLGTICWGVFPFLMVMSVCVVILIAFPQISLFLPAMMR